MYTYFIIHIGLSDKAGAVLPRDITFVAWQQTACGRLHCSFIYHNIKAEFSSRQQNHPLIVFLYWFISVTALLQRQHRPDSAHVIFQVSPSKGPARVLAHLKVQPKVFLLNGYIQASTVLALTISSDNPNPYLPSVKKVRLSMPVGKSELSMSVPCYNIVIEANIQENYLLYCSILLAVLASQKPPALGHILWLSQQPVCLAWGYRRTGKVGDCSNAALSFNIPRKYHSILISSSSFSIQDAQLRL